MEWTIEKMLVVFGLLVFMLVVNYLINRAEFRKEMSKKSTDELMNHMMNNRKTKGWRKKRLFAYITRKRGSQILKPTPLTKDQIAELPKGKHYVMRKDQMKKS